MSNEALRSANEALRAQKRALEARVEALTRSNAALQSLADPAGVEDVTRTVAGADLGHAHEDLGHAHEEAFRRALQHEAAATLDRFALSAPALPDVFARAVELVAEAVQAPLAEVLRHDAETGALRLEASVGWAEDAADDVAEQGDIVSQSEHALVADRPVVVSGAEPPSVGPDAELGRGAGSGISVRVEGPDGTPWGVLGVHAREPRRFTDADGRFVESVAAVLSAALRRERDEATIREQYAEIEAVYEAAPVGLAFMDKDLRHRRINRRLADINGASVEAHIGRRPREIVPGLSDKIEPLLRHVAETGEAVEGVEIRGHTPTDPDGERVWLCSYVPVAADGERVGVSVVVLDITDRTRAEDAARASEERLRLAMGAGRLGTFRRDFAEGTLAFDARCQELYGLPDGEAAAVALDRVHPDDRGAVEAAVARATDPADPADDYAVRHRLLVDGEDPRWISVQARVQFDGEGPGRRPAHMIGVALDMTAMRETERELEDARAQLSLALAVVDAGTFDVDLGSGTVTYDDGSQRLLDLPSEMALDEAFRTIHPTDRGGVEAAVEAATDPAVESDVFRSVHRQLRPDGHVLWIAAHGLAQFDGDGPSRRPVRLLGTLADITRLKEAQDAARRQLVEIDSYFDAIPVAIAVFDQEGRYVRVNGSMEALIGRPAAEVVGRLPADVVSGDHVDANGPFLRRVLSTGEPVRDVEMSLPAPSDSEGGLRDWLLNFVPLVDAGEVTGATLVVQDVTPLKRAQAGLETLTAELEARVVLRTTEVRRLVGDLTEAERRERGRVAQILHDDLQQLLYAVQFKFEAMRRATPRSGPALLDQADDLVARAIQVTRTLTVDLRPPVLRGEGLDRTFEWLAHRMHEAYGLDVTVDREGDVQAGKTVQVLLFQIVRELLFNVVKHAGTASATIRVGGVEPDRVRVVVADNGVGFEPEDPDEGEASGVGLVSVRERIRLVGGSVSIRSAPGGGSEIEIVCPSTL